MSGDELFLALCILPPLALVVAVILAGAVKVHRMQGRYKPSNGEIMSWERYCWEDHKPRVNHPRYWNDYAYGGEARWNKDVEKWREQEPAKEEWEG